eukprot:10082990-Karenia_brevis.AAC.1
MVQSSSPSSGAKRERAEPGPYIFQEAQRRKRIEEQRRRRRCERSKGKAVFDTGAQPTEAE